MNRLNFRSFGRYRNACTQDGDLANFSFGILTDSLLAIKERNLIKFCFKLLLLLLVTITVEPGDQTVRRWPVTSRLPADPLYQKH